MDELSEGFRVEWGEVTEWVELILKRYVQKVARKRRTEIVERKSERTTRESKNFRVQMKNDEEGKRKIRARICEKR